jgi:hypothetical protein
MHTNLGKTRWALDEKMVRYHMLKTETTQSQLYDALRRALSCLNRKDYTQKLKLHDSAIIMAPTPLPTGIKVDNIVEAPTISQERVTRA